MADFPAGAIAPVQIHSFGGLAGTLGFDTLPSGSAGFATGAWPSANLGIFVPVTVPGLFTIKSFFTVNGTTANGNIDIGLFGVDGSLITSKGATAQSGTSAYQILSLGTPVRVSPGRYYLALSCSSGTGTIMKSAPTAAALQMCGVLQAASQNPLATAPTFASPGQAYLPFFGMSQRTVY